MCVRVCVLCVCASVNVCARARVLLSVQVSVCNHIVGGCV